MAGFRYRQGPAIPRLREMANALPLTEAEKSGPVLAVFGRPHVQQVKRAFASEGATTGEGAWPRLNAAYAAWKRTKVGNVGMLIFTREFWKAAVIEGRIILEYTPPNTYGLGFEDEIGALHETGTHKMPRRSVLSKSPADKKELIEAFVTFWINRTKAIVRNSARLRNAGS